MMRWYYMVMGGHTHVRVFMNGGKCGALCFRNDEFQRQLELSALARECGLVEMIAESWEAHAQDQDQAAPGQPQANPFYSAHINPPAK